MYFIPENPTHPFHCNQPALTHPLGSFQVTKKVPLPHMHNSLEYPHLLIKVTKPAGLCIVCEPAVMPRRELLLRMSKREKLDTQMVTSLTAAIFHSLTVST